MTPEELVAAVRPGVRLRRLESAPDEVVLAGGGEVFRLPRTAQAAEESAAAVRALPHLRALVPVRVPAPRFVGVLADGATPFTAERRLAGTPGLPATSTALGQLAGLLEALAAVPEREAMSWGVPGSGHLLHGALSEAVLLADPSRGVLIGVAGWRPRLGDRAEDLAGLDPEVRRQL